MAPNGKVWLESFLNDWKILCNLQRIRFAILTALLSEKKYTKASKEKYFLTCIIRYTSSLPLVFTLMSLKNLHNYFTWLGMDFTEDNPLLRNNTEISFKVTTWTCSGNLIPVGGFLHEASQTLEISVSRLFTHYHLEDWMFTVFCNH